MGFSSIEDQEAAESDGSNDDASNPTRTIFKLVNEAIDRIEVLEDRKLCNRARGALKRYFLRAFSLGERVERGTS